MFINGSQYLIHPPACTVLWLSHALVWSASSKARSAPAHHQITAVERLQYCDYLQRFIKGNLKFVGLYRAMWVFVWLTNRRSDTSRQ
jgi:hypothetical protein